MSAERREFSRVSVSFPVVFVPEGGEPLDGRIGDISVAGAFILTDAALPVGTRCSIVVHLMGDVAIEGQGEVVRTGPDGVALELESLGLDSYEHLCNLVVYNAEDCDVVREEINAHSGIRRRGTPLPLSPNA